MARKNTVFNPNLTWGGGAFTFFHGKSPQFVMQNNAIPTPPQTLGQNPQMSPLRFVFSKIQKIISKNVILSTGL